MSVVSSLDLRDRYRGAMLGLAIGTTLEVESRGSFEIVEFADGLLELSESQSSR
jgi:hypothetical protein